MPLLTRFRVLPRGFQLACLVVFSARCRSCACLWVCGAAGRGRVACSFRSLHETKPGPDRDSLNHKRKARKEMAEQRADTARAVARWTVFLPPSLFTMPFRRNEYSADLIEIHPP